MQSFRFHISRLRSSPSLLSSLLHDASALDPRALIPRHFSSRSGGGNDATWDNAWNAGPGSPPVAEGGTGGGGDAPVSGVGWDEVSPWSTGLTEEHFDGKAVGRRREPWEVVEMAARAEEQSEEDIVDAMEKDNRRSKEFVDGWGERMKATAELLKQVREPGARGSYLKDSEKAEMYRLHKENPELYTVERLAKDYRIMRQRVHAILWLKEIEEEEEKKLGRPLDDSIEQLLDACPEYV